MAEDLIALLYDEAAGEERRAIDVHLAACAGCRAELESMRETLRTIDSADLRGMADALAERRMPALPVPAPPLPFQLPSPARISRSGWWLRAAAALVLAGGGFLAGALVGLPASLGLLSGPAPAEPTASRVAASPPRSASPGDPDTLLRDFSEKTGGYLNRSRMVLLEVANAETGSDPDSLQEVIGNLIRESREARRVADQIADPRIEEVVVRLEAILREISRLANWSDPTSIERLRDRVNASGMLEELELLIPAPARLAQGRSRT